jgi:hypothetical protein
MKRALKSLTFILALVGLYHTVMSFNQSKETKVVEAPAVPKVLEEKEISKKQEDKRSPASIKKVTKTKNKRPQPFFPRKSKGMKRFKGLKVINRPNPKWKGNLKDSIFRFGFKADNFKINHIESVARKEGQKVRNLEWVKISYTQKGLPHMYDALVDSASGRVIQSWNHVKYENPLSRLSKPSFNLKGLLKKP